MHFKQLQLSNEKCFDIVDIFESWMENEQQNEAKCNWWKASLIKNKLNKLKQIMIGRREAIMPIEMEFKMSFVGKVFNFIFWLFKSRELNWKIDIFRLPFGMLRN